MCALRRAEGEGGLRAWLAQRAACCRRWRGVDQGQALFPFSKRSSCYVAHGFEVALGVRVPHPHTYTCPRVRVRARCMCVGGRETESVRAVHAMGRRGRWAAHTFTWEALHKPLYSSASCSSPHTLVTRVSSGSAARRLLSYGDGSIAFRATKAPWRQSCTVMKTSRSLARVAAT